MNVPRSSRPRPRAHHRDCVRARDTSAARTAVDRAAPRAARRARPAATVLGGEAAQAWSGEPRRPSTAAPLLPSSKPEASAGVDQVRLCRRDPMIIELPQAVHLTCDARRRSRRRRAGRRRSSTGTRRAARACTRSPAAAWLVSVPVTTRVVTGAVVAGGDTGGACEGSAAGTTTGRLGVTASSVCFAELRFPRSDSGPEPLASTSAFDGVTAVCRCLRRRRRVSHDLLIWRRLRRRAGHLIDDWLGDVLRRLVLARAEVFVDDHRERAAVPRRLPRRAGVRSRHSARSRCSSSDRRASCTSDVPSLTSSGSDATATEAPLVEKARRPTAIAAWTAPQTSSSDASGSCETRWRRQTGQPG